MKIKTSKFITEQELIDMGKNIEYSLLQCVDCGRWIDMCKNKIVDWKFEKEMAQSELEVVAETKRDIANGKGAGYSTCKHCRIKYANSNNWYRTAKSKQTFKEKDATITPEERQQVKSLFGDKSSCSFAKDEDGYYCYTHRARSDSYPSIDKIPKSKVEFIGSTG
jgi:hypothetical protein